MKTNARWEYDWPPDHETTFPGIESPHLLADHEATIRKWLKQSKVVSALPKTTRDELVERVHGLDFTASRIQEELDKAGWNAERVRNTIVGKLSAKEHNQYRDHSSRVSCVQACAAAREAIFQGNWAAAIEAAFRAGLLSVAAHSRIGSPAKHESVRSRMNGASARKHATLSR